MFTIVPTDQRDAVIDSMRGVVLIEHSARVGLEGGRRKNGHGQWAMIAERLLRLCDGRNAAAGNHVGPGDRAIGSRDACIASAIGRRIRIAGLGRVTVANQPVEDAGPPSSATTAATATTQRVLL